ncbi:MAG: hypothetical protein WEF50_10565 [Myxococcota bacterium]
MRDPIARNVRVAMDRGALTEIFDECDGHSEAETGGRLVGVYERDAEGALLIRVSHVIGPGPSARRTAVSFFQDGAYQERVFRDLEAKHPEIEHLGNWHSHHVNGMPTLSEGDRATYHRIVDHRNHNTDFFYALLIVSKNARGIGDGRYRTRHFLVRRNDPNEYEISESDVEVFGDVGVSVLSTGAADRPDRQPRSELTHISRAFDQSVLGRVQPELKPFYSKRAGGFCWKGVLKLIDNSTVGVVVAETAEDDGRLQYRVQVLGAGRATGVPVEAAMDGSFSSATEAVWTVERFLNSGILERRLRRSKRRGDASGA